ncbi:tripartite tricarboxylate transporter TctB family protein [Bradyrhizobium archetypum]|jgi:putative tricarboxylic transport membrane protein|uniref:Tripartite tricarboxylate transporter TctB family protein n=1 Tax=Bradyrhizobium archetypum TaxID=2721160 RepID=A0A7Y4H710_9BRAD|nr:tripartite tricarboxylate transporter TctB family protein [Bradyrhizobium archetypum]NOJ48469.1 tripartite tricarboxylate transporter TctB family protein [Bradyrhizobium archetypum]
MRLGRDSFAGLIFLAVSLVLLVQSFGLPHLPLVPVGPGFYPRIVLIFMAVTSAALIVQDLLARRAEPADVPAPARPRRAYGLVALSFVIVALYLVLLPLLGYRIATVLFVAALQATLERPATWRQWAVFAAVAIGTSAVTYLVFERYLSVLLPRGNWTNW